MTIYQIYLSDKQGKIIFSKTLAAEDETKAIEKAKVGSVIKELGLARDGVNFFIGVAGHLYEGKMFAGPLAKTPELTADEKKDVQQV